MIMGFLGWTSTVEESVPSEVYVEEYSDGENNGMELNREQRDKLNRFCERVKSKIPSHMDSKENLLRWLTARNFDENKAEDMLLKSIAWRKEWMVDSVLEWTPPEVLKKYYAAGMSGYGKNGAPVIIIPYGSSDVKGMLHCCSSRDFIKYTIQILEMSMEAMKQKSAEVEKPITKEIFIFDLDHFSWKDFTWGPGMNVILQLVQMYEANYPEIMQTALVINAPTSFHLAFKVIKPFIHEVTLRKIKIFGKEGWKSVLLQSVLPDQLPEHWGGHMTDPDGDPKCPSMICVGGKVPKEYYLENNEHKIKPLEELNDLLLPKAGKKVFEMEVENPSTELRWTFHTDDYDIGFEIKCLTSLGKEEVLLPYQKVNSHIVQQEGSIICTNPGLYKIIFDNHYSYLRSKKLYYSLELSPPANQED